MSGDQTAKRLSDLEMQIAEQNRTIDELNDTLVSQWKEIDRLTRGMKLLSEQVLSLEDSVAPQGATKPPHY